MAKLQLLGIVMPLLLVTGCTHIPRGGKEQVAGLLQDRIGKEVPWNNNCYEDPRINTYVHDLASQPISIESAIQIALCNNPEVKAIFEEIGIAQADLVEAGLFSNPVFSLEVRYPHKQKLLTNIEYLITASFLDIFLIPLRMKLASTELQQTQLRVTNAILDLAFDVRQTYYELVAEQHTLTYTRLIAELANIQHEISSRQFAAGNIYKLDMEEMRALLLETELEIAKSQKKIINYKQKLNKLFGFSEDISLTFPEALPDEIDYRGIDLCLLESLALRERLDLQIARFEIIRFSRMLGLKDWWTYTHLEAGLAGERETDGLNTLGYGLAGEIPIFNYGQAARMRLFAQLRQAQQRLAALEINVLSEVREAHRLLMEDLKIINAYRDEIIPLQNHILSSSEELYNVMGLGIDRLLMNKKHEIATYRDYLSSLKDYWISRVKLDYALGGYLYRLLRQKSEYEGVEL